MVPHDSMSYLPVTFCWFYQFYKHYYVAAGKISYPWRLQTYQHRCFSVMTTKSAMAHVPFSFKWLKARMASQFWHHFRSKSTISCLSDKTSSAASSISRKCSKQTLRIIIIHTVCFIRNVVKLCTVPTSAFCIVVP